MGSDSLPPLGKYEDPWVALTDAAGTPYFYNLLTDESKWHQPGSIMDGVPEGGGLKDGHIRLEELRPMDVALVLDHLGFSKLCFAILEAPIDGTTRGL